MQAIKHLARLGFCGEAEAELPPPPATGLGRDDKVVLTFGAVADIVGLEVE